MSRKPIYRRILEDIENSIKSSEYKRGDRIPTEAEWAERYGVSRITAQKGLDLAVENGLIEKIPGKGSFIKAAQKDCLRKQGTHRVIALIQPIYPDTYGLEVFTRITELAQESDCLLLTGISQNNIELEKKLINQFRDFGVDGFIIYPSHEKAFNMELLKLILDHFPVVLIDRYLKDIPCTNIVSGNLDAAYRGMMHLIENGHKSIGILSRPIDKTSTLRERELGIKNAAAELGLQLSKHHWLTSLEGLDERHDLNVFESHKKKIKDFLTDNPKLTALFGLESTVIKIAEAAAFELGLKIPEDLSLLCFDSNGFHNDQLLRITHLQQNEAEIGRLAFESLSALIEGKAVAHHQEVPVELIKGRSVRKLNHKESR